MSKYVGNLIPHTFFITKGSGESDLELHAGSYHMALHDAGISDFNIMVYSSVLPATAHIASMDEIDLPPFGSELKTILAVSHGQQDEFVSAGVVYAWMYADENFDKKVGGLVCEVSGRYRIEELEARLIRVINDLHQKTYAHYYLGELNFVTEGITIEKRYGTGWPLLRRLPAARGRACRAPLLASYARAPRAGEPLRDRPRQRSHELQSCRGRSFSMAMGRPPL